MSLLFTEGFDWTLDKNNLVRKGWSGSYTFGSVGTAYRRGSVGNGFMLPVGAAWIAKLIPSNLSTIVVGFAFYLNGGGSPQFFYLMDGSTAQLAFDWDPVNKQLYVFRGGYGLLLGVTGTNSIQLYTWYYMEVKATIHDTAGAVEVRINGTSLLNLTNVDTKNTANAYVNTLWWGDENGGGAGSNAGPFFLDDLYVCSTSGSVNNDFLGDRRIITVFPNVDSSPLQFTPSTGSDHYAVVDETNFSGSDYVYSETAGHRDQFGMENLSYTPTSIAAVSLNVNATKSDAGSRSLKQYVKSSSSENLSSAKNVTYGSGLSYQHIVEQDPNGTVAWTKSAVDSMEVGVEVV